MTNGTLIPEAGVWTDEAYAAYKNAIPEGARIEGPHAGKAVYGRMPPVKTAYMIPQGAREEHETLQAALKQDQLTDTQRATIETQLRTPTTRLGVAFYEKYGPQYTLDDPRKAFMSASADTPAELSATFNPAPKIP